MDEPGAFFIETCVNGIYCSTVTSKPFVYHMKYFLLFYQTVDNYIERRAPYREAHLALANQARDRGELFMAGALADPADGAVLVFRGADASVAEEFARNDPYVRAGLIHSWQVRPWTVVIGGDAKE